MIQSLIIPKKNLVCIPESCNCLDALSILEDNSQRCAPVLDATNTLYRGNIYRYHIYQYHFHHPEVDLRTLPVTPFLKNTTRVVHEEDSFFKMFFSMADLPYIAVLNQQNSFVGIVNHSQMLDFFSQALAIDEAGWLLEVQTIGAKGELSKIAKLINRHCDITACTTFEQTEYDTPSRCLFILPNYLDQLSFNLLVRDLTRRGYMINHDKIN
ncbi:cyclic di-AMP binding protein CbpA [Vaginisenegalia massiliensis]|uniref:cyclic di-AMP binding protein CbpA n=1 Tax=Vaginisenegalia massiliensis TaxID=2058294 RepID=UPI0024071C20|nr:cyclic di-AMP binding protein CbpA [Vaginisenegalia massiliensis]